MLCLLTDAASMIVWQWIKAATEKKKKNNTIIYFLATAAPDVLLMQIVKISWIFDDEVRLRKQTLIYSGKIA